MAKRILSMILLIFVLFTISSCKPAEKIKEPPQDDSAETPVSETNEIPVSGGTLNLCLFEVDTLNPLLTKNEGNLDVLSLMYDSLFTVSDDSSIKNSLCESYEATNGGLNYAFKIRDGVKFHDGTALTASDVDASFKLIIDSQSPHCVKFLKVSETHADYMTWHVTLSEPIINFPALLDFPIIKRADAARIYPTAKAPGEFIFDISSIPVGTGLYKLSEYKISKILLLNVSEEHFSGKSPYIPNIKIYITSDKEAAVSMFENLAIDVLPKAAANLGEYTPKRKLKTIHYPTNKFTFLGVNNQSPLLISPNVRRAISMCIDINSISGSTQPTTIERADIPINPGSYLYNKDLVPVLYDIKEAQKLLKKDGFTDPDENGILEKQIYGEHYNLSLDVLVNSENTIRSKIINTIKPALEQAGFSINITTLNYDAYVSRIESGNYDLFVGGLDISPNFDLSFMLETEKNAYGIANEKIDLCLNQLRLLSNPDAFVPVYADICTELSETMPIIGLYFENGDMLCDDDLKGNIKPTQNNTFANIEEWFLKRD